MANTDNCAAPDFVVPNWESRCTWYPGVDPATSPHTKKPLGPPKKILSDILETIGNTPLVRLNKIPQAEGLKCEMLVKCEFFNPAGSVKDRIAYRMVADAEEKGLIKPGDTIIEPSSGNTGIGLGMVCAIKGYKCMIVMPERMSNEKVDTMKALGVQVVKTPILAGPFSPNGIFGVSQRLQKETPNSIILDQFSNPSNPLAHYETTAQEIYDQCDGKVDMIVAGSGTGGTLTGLARKMKEVCPDCKVIGVDPEGSVMARPESLNTDTGKLWEMEGIGYFIAPTTLEHKVIDSWLKTNDKKALPMAKRLILEEGLLCGGTSGAHVAAAIEAARSLKEGQRCVVILPDSIRNYLSKFVSDPWMEVRNLQPCPNLLNHWWWDDKISKLDLDPPISILPTTTCRKTLNLLRKLGIDQIPVIAKCGKLEGLATVAELTTQLLYDRVKPECPISKALMTKFAKLKSDVCLGVVSKALEIDGFAVIVENDENNEEVFSALITPTDLLQYISENSSCKAECTKKCT